MNQVPGIEDSINARIKQEARKLLLWAWDEVKTKDPNQVSIRETPSGEIEFLIKIDEVAMGRAEIVYSPQSFIETLIGGNEKNFEHFAQKYPEKLAVIESVRLYLVDQLKSTVSIIVRNLYGEFYKATVSQGILALHLFFEGTPKLTKRHLGSLIRNSELKRIIEELDEDRKEIYELFVNELKTRKIAPKFLFAVIYPNQLQLWQEAKEEYKKNSDLDSIKIKFPELPEPLIGELKLRGSSTPHHLALRSTARIVKVPEDINSISALQYYLRASKKILKSTPKETVEKAFQHFKKFIFDQAEISERIKKLSEFDKLNKP